MSNRYNDNLGPDDQNFDFDEMAKEFFGVDNKYTPTDVINIPSKLNRKVVIVLDPSMEPDDRSIVRLYCNLSLNLSDKDIQQLHLLVLAGNKITSAMENNESNSD